MRFDVRKTKLKPWLAELLTSIMIQGKLLNLFRLTKKKTILHGIDVWMK